MKERKVIQKEVHYLHSNAMQTNNSEKMAQAHVRKSKEEQKTYTWDRRGFFTQSSKSMVKG